MITCSTEIRQPSSVVTTSVTYPTVRFKGGGTRFSALLLEDKYMKSSSGIAEDTSVVLFFVHTGG